MQLSTRGRYAVMALVDLAARGGCDCRPVTLADIAGAQALSLSYLEQLFCRLRRAGLVASARGPGGGYRLARPATQITLADIVLAVEENLQATRCAAETGCMPGEGANARCRTQSLWDELGRHIHLFFAGITLDDVVRDQVAGRARPPADLLKLAAE